MRLKNVFCTQLYKDTFSKVLKEDEIDKFHCPGGQAFCGCGSFPSRSRTLLCSLLCLLAVLPAKSLLLPVAGKGIFRQLRVLLCGDVYKRQSIEYIIVLRLEQYKFGKKRI